MHAEIKEGFASLARERKRLTNVLLDEIGDIGTKRLKSWPLFNTTCVIAEAYRSDVRKKLKLEMASDYLMDAKREVKEYNISQDNFLKVETALQSVIKTIGQLVIGDYKSSVLNMGDEVGTKPELKK